MCKVLRISQEAKMKTFIRSILEDKIIEFSWYDKNGRRYKHETMEPLLKSVEQFIASDNTYGYMSYAEKNDFKIIDSFKGVHPKNLVK
jgi:hypothetical protein